jgi:hypothetical protein
MRRLLLRSLGVALGLLLAAGTSEAQNPGGYFGGPCEPGQVAFGGFLMVCSDAGTFRYALHEDIPPAPEGGHVERPSWYPRLGDVLRAQDPPRCPATGRVTFTSPVIRPQDLLTTVPQGMMVGDHVTPIDHGYIGVKPLAKPRASRTEADYVRITSPADAEVIEVSSLGSPTSTRIVLAHGCETYSILMVVNRLSGALAYLQDDLRAQQHLNPHVRVLAGEELGEQRDNPLDFSVHDGSTWLTGFVAPFSYTAGEAWKPYTVDPWPYFSPDLAAVYEASMQRTVAPRWGQIDQDVAGTAAGNWYIAGTVGYSGRRVEDFRSATAPLRGGPVEGKNYSSWSHLAIVHHWVQPGRWIFSIGWWRDEKGDPMQKILDVASGQPDPSQLTPASGAVVYRVRNWETSPPPTNDSPAPVGYTVTPTTTVSIVALQVNANETLTVELVVGAQDPSTFRGFSSAKRTYRR